MNNMRRTLHALPLSALACLALAMTGCGKGGGNTPAADRAEAGGTPVQGDWVVIHSISDPEDLNYLTSNDAGSQEIHTYMYETLTTTDWETLETIPWIADSLPKISDDKLSYEFRLKKEAKFADGKPVTAADFIFYLKALKNPYVVNAAPQRSYYTRVDRAEMIDNDPYRLRVVMSEPYYLGDQFAGGLLALPKHLWDPKGLTDKMSWEDLNKNDPNKNPVVTEFSEWFQDVSKGMSKDFLVGSGPYVFESWTRNQSVVLVRNPDYWNKAHKWGQAYPDRLVWRSINDQNAAMSALKSGEIDFIPLTEKILYNQEKSRFESNGLVGAEYDYPSYSYIGYNQENPIFADKLVRQALAHAINREAIIKTIYFGMARPVQSPIGFKRPEADTTIPIIPYDIAKAKALLTQAGWADTDADGILDKNIDGKKTKFSFKVLLNSGNDRRAKIATIFVQELKKIGIDASTSSLDWALFLDRTRDAAYDAYIGGWAMNVVEGDMYQIWHSESATRGGSNYVKFRNPQVDTLIGQIRSEFDFAKRVPLYKEIQRIIHEEQPYNFLVTEKYTGAHSNRFQNVKFYAPRPTYRANEWWVPLQAQKYKAQKQVASAQ